MGTMIHLFIGKLQIDWGKNSGFRNHSVLFQKEDLGTVQDFGYTEDVICDGFSRPLRRTVKRLELIGYTMEAVRREYEGYVAYWDRSDLPDFDDYCEIIKSIDVTQITGTWSEAPPNRFIPSEILERFGHNSNQGLGSNPDYWDVELMLEYLSPYSILRLLAENEGNLDLLITWPFGELVEAGWTSIEEVTSELEPSQKFLIITEGGSDTKIIQLGLSVLGADYQDFFQFVDVDKGQQFDGTESLYKFCKRLVSIGVLNQVIFLFDNDTAGTIRCRDIQRLALPKNIRVTKLPDIPALREFNTIGPSGENLEDINGKAASIECYLDLNHKKAKKSPTVRWSSYMDAVGEYQGALESKEDYSKHFLNIQHKDPTYDYSKLEMLINHLYAVCVDMAKSETFTPKED